MDNQLDVVDVALIREQVRDFLTTNFLFDGDISQVNEDASLIEQGILDATGVLELVLFVEETYDLNVNKDDLQLENFDSINALVSYVERRLA